MGAAAFPPGLLLQGGGICTTGGGVSTPGGSAAAPYVGGACDVPVSGTVTVQVLDDVLGPVAFRLHGDPGCPALSARGEATFVVPSACVAVDVIVDAGAIAGVIRVV